MSSESSERGMGKVYFRNKVFQLHLVNNEFFKELSRMRLSPDIDGENELFDIPEAF